jgi:hypothetical protein
MLVAADQERRLRLLNICHRYRRLTDRAVQNDAESRRLLFPLSPAALD